MQIFICLGSSLQFLVYYYFIWRHQNLVGSYIYTPWDIYPRSVKDELNLGLPFVQFPYWEYPRNPLFLVPHHDCCSTWPLFIGPPVVWFRTLWPFESIRRWATSFVFLNGWVWVLKGRHKPHSMGFMIQETYKHVFLVPLHSHLSCVLVLMSSYNLNENKGRPFPIVQFVNFLSNMTYTWWQMYMVKRDSHNLQYQYSRMFYGN